MDRRRHPRGGGHEQRPCPTGCSTGAMACMAPGSYSPPGRQAAAFVAAGVPPPASRTRCWANASRRARRCSENDGVRLWTDGDDIGVVVGFKTKMHGVGCRARRHAGGDRHRRAPLPGPRALAAEGAVFSGTDLAGALGALAGKLAEFGRWWSPTPGHQPGASSIRWCRWSRRCAAWRSAAAASSRCTTRARWPTSKSHSPAWSGRGCPCSPRAAA